MLYAGPAGGINMGEFCDYLKEIKVGCAACWENGIGACHVKLGEQEYYPGFGLADSIQIVRHNHRLTVETDIEVKYKTEYPWGAQAGKGAEFAVEQVEKEKRLRDYLEPKLPRGVRLLPLHRHYDPQYHDPKVAVFHIHIHKPVEDLDEAKVLVETLVETIKPREIEAAIAPGR